jgi:hypothetical protein
VGYVTYVEEIRNIHKILVTDSQNKKASGSIILKSDFSNICCRQDLNDSGTVQLRNIQVPKKSWNFLASSSIHLPNKDYSQCTSIITHRTHFDNSYLEWAKYGPLTVQSDLQKYSNIINNIAIY